MCEKYLESIKIVLPKRANSSSELQNEELSLGLGKTTIIIGANGSGKTKLAAYIEEQLGEKAHRISAHRALSLEPSVSKIPEKKAEKLLKIGSDSDSFNISDRNSLRWKHKSSTYLLNDFNILLQYLFAQQANLAVLNNQKYNKKEEIIESETKLDRLKKAWELLLPHRRLHITADDIQVSSINSGNSSYSASELSDGERAIFYILGQVLAASENSVLIFDEPELHIHKSIISNLWDKVEELRPDCYFLIITHDIEFAATRTAKKYVIRNYYTDPAWDITYFPDSQFDEETISLILGSRKPILFIEGILTSLDNEVYRHCYPEWTVIPRGSCKDVIQAVSSIRNLTQNMPLLNIRCAGIVDLDSREDDELNKLNSLNIHVLPVSEIENIFSLPNIAKEILKIEKYSDLEIDEKLKAFKTGVIEYVKEDLNKEKLNKFVIKKIRRKIDNYLKNIDLSSEITTDSIIEKLKK